MSLEWACHWERGVMMPGGLVDPPLSSEDARASSEKGSSALHPASWPPRINRRRNLWNTTFGESRPVVTFVSAAVGQ